MESVLTILICTHNRADLLSKLLNSINSAQRPRVLLVDVLVVANACSDSTHEYLREYCQRSSGDGLVPLQWLAEPRPGKAHALNRGASALAGDWVAIVDDDHRVAVDFLVQIEQAMEAHVSATMLCGRILPDWDGTEPSWVHDAGPYRVYPLPIPRQDFGPESRELDSNGPIPGGGNQIIRLDALRKIGQFLGELGPQGHDLGGGEDTEYMLRALSLGARLWYSPAVVQYHYVDPERLNLTYLLRKAYKRSAATVGFDNQRIGISTIPPYLFRKLAAYTFSALISISSSRRRFYLVRCAAALGEMAGHIQIAQRRGSAAPMDR